MALIRMARMLVALLLVAVAAPAAGAVVHSAPVAGPPAPVVAVAPPVAVHTTGAVSAPVTATDDDEDDDPQTIPAEDLLNPDGTLHLDGTFNGAVDISGWNVALDPDNGPIFSPQALTYTWENLGTGVEGVLNGDVHAIAISGTDVYVGGRFTNAGGVTGANYLARWDGAQWHAVGGASAINNQVNTIAISGTDVYVGGEFTDAGGNSAADYLARWDGTQWYAVGGANAINASVNAIAISGANVYVGGGFTDAGGNPNADRIARWDGTNWNALGTGISGFGVVTTIALSGTDVYVGGNFTDAGGVSGANSIARWDGAQWYTVGGANAIPGSSFAVYAIAISGTNVYVGGFFTTAGGVSDANYIARWDGTTWSGLLSGTFGINSQVNTIALSGTDVYVGGRFTNAGGVPGANSIARWDGAQWHTVGGANAIPGSSSAVYAIAITGTDVYVGGFFTNAGGNNANDFLTRWTGSSFVPPGSKTARPLNGTVYTVAVSGTDVYVGGRFTNAGNVPGANSIARWDGAQWHAVGGANAINDNVYAVAISGTNVYVGGSFISAGGVPGTNFVARWDGMQWSGLLSGTVGLNRPVYTIAISGTDVYVGGDFTADATLGASGVNYIARWNGTSWSGLLSGTVGLSGPVYTIAISGTDVYAGGRFANAGGVRGANYIARWNSANNTWNRVGGANAISGDFRTVVRVIVLSGSDVYVGGNFTNAGGVSGANNIARWDGTNWNAVGGASAINDNVYAVAISGENVYVGGDFTKAGGNSAADYLARWDGVQWTALVSGTAGVFGPVYALAVPSSDDVYAGGNFLNTGNNPFADYIARYALATKRVYLPLIVR
ncbi:beta strand repeat-containing protein [Roseiflexus sp.]